MSQPWTQRSIVFLFYRVKSIICCQHCQLEWNYCEKGSGADSVSLYLFLIVPLNVGAHDSYIVTRTSVLMHICVFCCPLLQQSNEFHHLCNNYWMSTRCCVSSHAASRVTRPVFGWLVRLRKCCWPFGRIGLFRCTVEFFHLPLPAPETNPKNSSS